MRAAGCAVAIASDFNPGSCYLANLPLLATMAGIHCGLSVTEVIAGVTCRGAAALGLGHRKGSLKPGYDADVLLHGARSAAEWVADAGETPPHGLWIGGIRV